MKGFFIGVLVAVILGGAAFWALSGESDESDVLGTSDTNTINIYFSVRPESVNQFAYTEGVARDVQSGDVYEFAINQLIAGPTEQEQEDGFYSSIELSGDSDCGGADYEYTHDLSTNILTLDFCRTLVSRQRGDEERTRVSIVKTLSTLDGVESVLLK